MAGYDKYDERLEGLVVEAKTYWDANVGTLEEEDQDWLARAIHQSPGVASKVHYERAHTGFTREITVTMEDIQRLYQERMAAE